MVSPQDIGKDFIEQKENYFRYHLFYISSDRVLWETPFFWVWTGVCNVQCAVPSISWCAMFNVHIAHLPSSPDVIFIRQRQRRERQWRERQKRERQQREKQRREPPFISSSSSDHKRQYSATWRRDWWEFPAFCLQNFPHHWRHYDVDRHRKGWPISRINLNPQLRTQLQMSDSAIKNLVF